MTRRNLLTFLIFITPTGASCSDGGSPIDADAADTQVVAGDVVADIVADTVADTATAPGTPLNHRAVAEVCDNERSMALPVIPDPYSGPIDCTVHADCVTGTNGRCVGNTHDGFYCTYDACFADSACGAFVCACAGGFRSDYNICTREGDCRVDADCGAGRFCSPSFGDCGAYFGVIAYYCHTAADDCVDDTDCGDVSGGGPYCAYNTVAGKWMCSNQQCAG